MTDWNIDYGPAPPIMVFFDSEAGRATLEHLLRKVDGRIAIAAPIADAAARLAAVTQVGAVLVDVAGEPSDTLERLIDRLEIAAEEGRFSSIVSVSPDLLDLAAARAPHPDVTILCDASEIEQVAAVAIAVSRAAATVPQFAEENGRLKQLSEEVGRIARTLAALSMEPGDARAEPPSPLLAEDAEPPTPQGLRMLIRLRRLREQFFPADLFADPAWDILLDLAASRAEGRQVAVSSLCIAAAVPATTALRWIKSLTDEGVLVRVADPHDGRRVFIELSQAAADGMAAYFQQVRRLMRVADNRG